ncbi:hypothetical protein R5R35_012273 [Gryllus longicercus]|uniref:CLIP domain-containing serine protease n=1 Tax=Gryllus longicercus TaxID=2509291 RepID=A0AAN9Z7L0_9ORTH
MGGRGRALLCWAALCSSLAAAVPAPAPALSREGEDCRTPRGEAGTCRNINACPSLLALVAQRPSQENLSLLNNLRCGFHGSVPIVCCTDGSSQPPAPAPAPPPTRPTGRPNPPPTQSMTDRPPDGQANSTPPDVSGHPNLKLLPQEYCSPPGNDRIVNGKEADILAYPWIARLGYLSRSSTSRPVGYHCGGSLINSRYVLTAAHCIATRTSLYVATVKLGEHTIDKPIDCRVNGTCNPPPIDIDVERTEVHPLYKPGVATHHDIALVRLSRPVDFRREELVRPVCLPVTRENLNLRLDGQALVAAGWGLTEDNVGSNVLKDVILTVVPLDKCKQVFERPGLQTEIIPQQLCAGGEAGKNACNGDSGGPLVMDALSADGLESKAVLFGIVSFGHNTCTTEGVPGVYTRVAYYMKWVLDTMTP